MKRALDIRTKDGTAKAAMFRPDKGAVKGGVIIYMDAFGPRPALDGMAERLTRLGYAVLVPDLFYRNAPYGPFNPLTAFNEEGSRAAITALIGGTTQAMSISDGEAFLDAMSAEKISPIATVGYCMGGARALNAAAAYPDRVAAAASFHGGNLASDAADSPYRGAAKIRAKIYVGTAGVDRSFPPEQSARLAEALRTAEVDHIIENYVGMQHGWCVPDHSVFNASGAERHWRRLAVFLAEAIAGES